MLNASTHDGAIVSIYSSHLGAQQRARMIPTKDRNGGKSVAQHLAVTTASCTCVFLPWLWRNNWDWWLSRVAATLAVTHAATQHQLWWSSVAPGMISRSHCEIKIFSVVAEGAFLILWFFFFYWFHFHFEFTVKPEKSLCCCTKTRPSRPQGGSDRNIYLSVSQYTVCLSCSQRGWGCYISVCLCVTVKSSQIT